MGTSKSIGDRTRTHGMRHTTEYRIYRGMINRCTYVKQNNFHLYGGRGIKVCERWLNSFEAFFADMGPRPSEKHSLDRIDTNGSYSPENCRWVTWVGQNNNRRNNRVFTHDGKTQTMAQWATECGIPLKILSQRLRRGKSFEQAIQAGALPAVQMIGA
jgi:hypothetical protein